MDVEPDIAEIYCYTCFGQRGFIVHDDFFPCEDCLSLYSVQAETTLEENEAERQQAESYWSKASNAA